MCAGRRPPARPDVPDGDDVDELFFGLRDVLLNQGGRWSDIGFNLDGYCTGSPDFGHECVPQQSGARPEPDGSDGIDNTFGGRLYPLVETAIPGLESTARQAQLEGIGFPAFRLRGWNGEANDPRVDVMITQAVASVAANADGSQPDVIIRDFHAELASGGPAPAPAWDGTDYFWARSDTFLAGDPEQPLVSDDNAYIADDTIVINLPDRVEILFATADAGVTVRLTGGLVTGHISADRTHVENVVVGGRWSVVDLRRTAENVGLCMGTFQYNGLEAML
jgi:hypothetical protein